MKIEFFQKLTLLDYPEKTACTVFTHGCNLRCPFCHNASLVIRKSVDDIPEEDFFKYLDKRKGLLDGVCITGGEPLIQKDIDLFIKKIKERGFLVKLDTNGFFPDKLKYLIDENLLDYVAMDIKNSPKKYPETCGIDYLDITNVLSSVEILKQSKIDFEFRTTVLKEYHTIEDLIEIGKWLSGDYKYFIQCFKDSGDTIKEGLSPFTESELVSFKNAVLPYLPKVSLRGV